MVSWPDGKSIAVGLIIPWEVWPDDLGTPHSHQRASQRPVPPEAVYPRDMWAVLDHQYGETQGLARIMNIFRDYDVKVSFVANGKRVEMNPELALKAQTLGHDMGSENYIHSYPVMFDEDGERETLKATVNAFSKVLGAPPTGYISPGHRSTPNTVPLLMELGFGWDADFQQDDVPFVVRDGDRSLVCMPYAHISDYHSFMTTGRTPGQVLEMLIDEFDVLRSEGLRGDPKMMGFAIHPYMCHGFRTKIIERFIDHVKACPDAWIATRSEIASWVLTHPNQFEQTSLGDIRALYPPT